MTIVNNPGIPMENPDNGLYGENHLQDPIRSIKSIQENMTNIKNHMYDGALIGMSIAAHVMVQEVINNAYSDYVAAPEKDLTCFEPSWLSQLSRATILTGALAGGVTGAMGLNSRLCATVASTVLLCARLSSQEPNLDLLNTPSAIATGLTILSLGIRGIDRLIDVINTVF